MHGPQHWVIALGHWVLTCVTQVLLALVHTVPCQTPAVPPRAFHHDQQSQLCQLLPWTQHSPRIQLQKNIRYDLYQKKGELVPWVGMGTPQTGHRTPHCPCALTRPWGSEEVPGSAQTTCGTASWAMAPATAAHGPRRRRACAASIGKPQHHMITGVPVFLAVPWHLPWAAWGNGEWGGSSMG